MFSCSSLKTSNRFYFSIKFQSPRKLVPCQNVFVRPSIQYRTCDSRSFRAFKGRKSYDNLRDQTGITRGGTGPWPTAVTLIILSSPVIERFDFERPSCPHVPRAHVHILLYYLHGRRFKHRERHVDFYQWHGWDRILYYYHLGRRYTALPNVFFFLYRKENVHILKHSDYARY